MSAVQSALAGNRVGQAHGHGRVVRVAQEICLAKTPIEGIPGGAGEGDLPDRVAQGAGQQAADKLVFQMNFSVHAFPYDSMFEVKKSFRRVHFGEPAVLLY
jgi:hypothetical protein